MIKVFVGQYHFPYEGSSISFVASSMESAREMFEKREPGCKLDDDGTFSFGYDSFSVEEFEVDKRIDGPYGIDISNSR